MDFIEAPTFTRTTTDRAPWSFKGSSNRGFREGDQVTAVLAHQTDVEGGFGVSRQAIKKHDGDALAARVERYGGTSMRRRGVPYHYVYSPQDVTLVALWHPRMYSYHGDGANAYSVGFAIDAKLPGDRISSELMGEAFRRMIEHLKSIDFDDVTYIEAHRQHSGARKTDPGRQVWQAIEPAAAELGIYPRPEHTTVSRKSGPGRPLPQGWRPEPSSRPDCKVSTASG